MSATLTTPLPRYLRTPEAARIVGLSIRTFEKHRIYGTGPRYSKLGGRVVYKLEDLQVWVESGAKASTSDPGVSALFCRPSAMRLRRWRRPARLAAEQVPAMSRRHDHHPERDQLELFRALPGDLAPRDAQDLDGLSLLQPGQDAPHDADRLPREQHRHSRRSGARARHGDYLGCRRADLGRQPDRRSA